MITACQTAARRPGFCLALADAEPRAAEAGSAKNERTRTTRNTRGQTVRIMTAPSGSTRVHPFNGRAKLLCFYSAAEPVGPGQK